MTTTRSHFSTTSGRRCATVSTVASRNTSAIVASTISATVASICHRFKLVYPWIRVQERRRDKTWICDYVGSPKVNEIWCREVRYPEWSRTGNRVVKNSTFCHYGREPYFDRAPSMLHVRSKISVRSFVYWARLSAQKKTDRSGLWLTLRRLCPAE